MNISYIALSILLLPLSVLLLPQSPTLRPTWWILVQEDDERCRYRPSTLGPFPSRELCRIAGHSVMPDDTRFWSRADIALDAERKANAQEAYRVAKDAFMKLNPKGGTWVHRGSTYTLNEKGEAILNFFTSVGSSRTCGGQFNALTACVYVPPQEPTP